MKKKQYDVVVVGGGHAGSISARFAALNGAETLLLEKKRQVIVQDSMAIIYDQPECEEAIGARLDPRCIYSKARGLVYYSPSGIAGKPHPLEGAFVDRNALERFLLSSAVRGGAEVALHARAIDLVKDNSAVKGVVIKDGKDEVAIASKIVIGADGAYGNVARWAGLELGVEGVRGGIGHEMVGVKRLGPSLPAFDEIYFGTFTNGVYGWVVPYDEDRMSIGVSFKLRDPNWKRPSALVFDGFLKHLENIGRYNFDKASTVNMMTGGEVSWSEQKLSYNIVGNGVMLAGVGAGKPTIGNRRGAPGMANGWFTGRWAGEAAAAAVKTGDVSANALRARYVNRITESLGDQRDQVLEARRLWNTIWRLPPALVDQAVKDISEHMADAHFYAKGGLELTSSCIKPMRDWLKEVKKGER